MIPYTLRNEFIRLNLIIRKSEYIKNSLKDTIDLIVKVLCPETRNKKCSYTCGINKNKYGEYVVYIKLQNNKSINIARIVLDDDGDFEEVLPIDRRINIWKKIEGIK